MGTVQGFCFPRSQQCVACTRVVPSAAMDSGTLGLGCRLPRAPKGLSLSRSSGRSTAPPRGLVSRHHHTVFCWPILAFELVIRNQTARFLFFHVFLGLFLAVCSRASSCFVISLQRVRFRSVSPGCRAPAPAPAKQRSGRSDVFRPGCGGLLYSPRSEALSQRCDEPPA